MAVNQDNRQSSFFRLAFGAVFMLNALIFFFQGLTKNLFPAGLAAKVGIGWLADRFGNNPVIFFNLTLSIASFIALTVVDSYLQILIVLALLGAMCLNTNTLINSYVLRHMPPRYQGAGFGLFSTAYTAIYSLGPYLTGFLSDFTGLSRAILVQLNRGGPRGPADPDLRLFCAGPSGKRNGLSPQVTISDWRLIL